MFLIYNLLNAGFEGKFMRNFENMQYHACNAHKT